MEGITKRGFMNKCSGTRVPDRLNGMVVKKVRAMRAGGASRSSGGEGETLRRLFVNGELRDPYLENRNPPTTVSHSYLPPRITVYRPFVISPGTRSLFRT